MLSADTLLAYGHMCVLRDICACRAHQMPSRIKMAFQPQTDCLLSEQADLCMDDNHDQAKLLCAGTVPCKMAFQPSFDVWQRDICLRSALKNDGAKGRLLNPDLAQAASESRGAMQTYLFKRLSAGLTIRELAHLLSTQQCLPALEELAAMFPSCMWGRSVGIAAAGAGKLEVLDWLSANSSVGKIDLHGCARAAAHTGQMAVIQWLLQQPSCSSLQQDDQWQTPILLRIFKLPGSQALEQLKAWHACTRIGQTAHGIARISHLAAARGSISILAWLQSLSSACTDTPDACIAAAAAGDLATLQWLRGHADRPWAWNEWAAMSLLKRDILMCYNGCELRCHPVHSPTMWCSVQLSQQLQQNAWMYWSGCWPLGAIAPCQLPCRPPGQVAPRLLLV